MFFPVCVNDMFAFLFAVPLCLFVIFMCLQVLQPMLADADRDASLRLGLLRLLDALMEQHSTVAAFGGQNAALVLKELLMPPLVWRAGKVCIMLACLCQYCSATCQKFEDIAYCCAAFTAAG